MLAQIGSSASQNFKIITNNNPNLNNSDDYTGFPVAIFPNWDINKMRAYATPNLYEPDYIRKSEYIDNLNIDEEYMTQLNSRINDNYRIFSTFAIVFKDDISNDVINPPLSLISILVPKDEWLFILDTLNDTSVVEVSVNKNIKFAIKRNDYNIPSTQDIIKIMYTIPFEINMVVESELDGTVYTDTIKLIGGTINTIGKSRNNYTPSDLDLLQPGLLHIKDFDGRFLEPDHNWENTTIMSNLTGNILSIKDIELKITELYGAVMLVKNNTEFLLFDSYIFMAESNDGLNVINMNNIPFKKKSLDPDFSGDSGE